MKEILHEVFSKINVQQTLKSVTDKGIEKLAASAVGATLVDIGTIFLAGVMTADGKTYGGIGYQAGKGKVVNDEHYQ